jgi:peroxiredoxin
MTTIDRTHAPAFDLPGVDGRSHSLDDYAGAAALVIVQSCNHCPYVQAWEQRLSSIQADYADRGVRLVAISSNDAEAYPEDSFEEMKARATSRRFTFDYLYDEDQSVARALGRPWAARSSGARRPAPGTPDVAVGNGGWREEDHERDVSRR